MTTHNVVDFDCVFLSYDEPNAEENFAHLLNIAPWAKRVHGVTGFDAAHKACAAISETERFITVDGDNRIDEAFFDVQVDLTETDVGHVFSWSGRNMTNGLVYGNGGLKLWTRTIVNNMRSHEVAVDDGSRVDFCWDLNYKHMNNCYSLVYANATPFQAFRAGFREGVKMTLDRGYKVNAKRIAESINERNYKRLLIWCSIGSDVENGLWSIYGARLGAWLTNRDDRFDHNQIASYEWFKSFWEDDIAPEFDHDSEEDLEEEIKRIGHNLRTHLYLPLPEFSKDDSLFFKAVYEPPPRTNAMVKEEEL